MDGSKALILLSGIAAAEILGSVVAPLYASDNRGKSRCPRHLAEEQRDNQTGYTRIREDGASLEETRTMTTEIPQRWGIRPPARRGLRTRVESWVAPTSGSTKNPSRIQTMMKARDGFSFPLLWIGGSL